VGEVQDESLGRGVRGEEPRGFTKVLYKTHGWTSF